MLDGLDKVKSVKIPGELYSMESGNVIADADYVLDRLYGISQHAINQLVMNVALAKFKLNYILARNADDYTLTVGVYAKHDSNDSTETLLESLTDKFIIFNFVREDGEHSGDINEISYSQWKAGISKSTLLSYYNAHGDNDAPVSVNILLFGSNYELLDEITVDLVDTAPALGRKLNTLEESIIGILSSISQINTTIASIPSGNGANLELANLQDIQAVFNMQYQQASSEVIDPHDNP